MEKQLEDYWKIESIFGKQLNRIVIIYYLFIFQVVLKDGIFSVQIFEFKFLDLKIINRLNKNKTRGYVTTPTTVTEAVAVTLQRIP